MAVIDVIETSAFENYVNTKVVVLKVKISLICM